MGAGKELRCRREEGGPSLPAAPTAFSAQHEAEHKVEHTATPAPPRAAQVPPREQPWHQATGPRVSAVRNLLAPAPFRRKGSCPPLLPEGRVG